MSGGLIALLDDIAAIAKIAAATLDDAAAQAMKAGSKAAGILIDDAAVTPRYVVGFAADRELPIIWKITLGSLKNKFFFLLPAALFLTAFAPWVITPLLIAGGAYLCFEGYEKLHEKFYPHLHAKPETAAADGRSSQELEDEKVASAIRTDMILSAEIMAITLSAMTVTNFWMQAFVLALVAFLVTVAVYGTVALIVKADDFGLALAQNSRPVSSLLGARTVTASGPPDGLDASLAPATQALGRGLVSGMPTFLQFLSIVGTLAMLWVGGGIIVHSLYGYGIKFIEQAILWVAAIPGGIPLIGGLVEWAVAATGYGLFGVAIGWAVAKAVAVYRGN
jgi:hypothetical protein